MRIDGNGPRRGSRRHLVAAAVTVLATTELRAQADANGCTGTVRDVAGAPLAGARVTFVQEWSQTFGRAMHRVEAATDADGRFTVTLHAGSPYFAWAIGPASEAGERLVSATTMRAGAGRTVDFVAHLPRAPRKLRLRGVAPWVDAAPPSLRVLVGGVYAVGRDAPLPGDGTVTVGPWPDDDVVVALVDVNGDVIERSELVEDSTTVIDLTPTRTFPVTVENGRGPVAGAEVWVQPSIRTWWLFPRDPVPAMSHVGWRKAATTDAEGRASIRVAWPDTGDGAHMVVVATHPEHSAAITGCIGNHFHRDGKPVAEDDALRFHLTARGPARWPIDGLTSGERPLVLFATHHVCRTRGMGTMGDLLWTATTDGTGAAAPLLTIGRDVHGLVRLPANGATAPHRVVVGSLGRPTELRPTELATAREHRFQFVDAHGRPAPFVDVAIAVTIGKDSRWHDRATSDGAGRLRLTCDRGAWCMLAASDDAFVRHWIAEDAVAGDTRVTLEPFPTATLRVRDAGGEPVAGARTDAARWTRPMSPSNDMWTVELARTLLRAVRSDATGLLRVPLPMGALGDVCWRDARGRRAQVVVDPNTAPADVTLR